MADIPNNYAGIWDLALEPPKAKTPPTESFFTLDSGKESVFDPDQRAKVKPADYQDGGKYRSIIKLMMRYERQAADDPDWGMGTGWLIAPDLLVTAGHCAYDFGENQYGRAVIVKAYLGYSGKGTVDTPAVQQRQGKTFITTSGWLKSQGSDRRSDVSFLKLDKPFSGNLGLFNFVDTPAKGSEEIGVVGYPADKSLGKERGAEMYELFSPTVWDLDTKVGNMLSYSISTFPGQSGSPVLRKSDRVSIGAHVYGGNRVNSASTIGGKYGNNFSALIKAFDEKSKSVTKIQGVDIIKPLTATADNVANGTISNGVNGNTSESAIGNTDDTEGFFDVLKSIGKVVLPAAQVGLSIGTPFLGPLGGPASAIGGVALGALGKMCESAMSSSPDKINFVARPTAADLDGCAHRAVLAEAALQTALKLDSSTPEAKKILSDMRASYRNLKPNVKIARKLYPALLNSTVKIAVEDLTKPRGDSSESALQVRKKLNTSQVDLTESSFGDSTQQKFVKELLGPTIQLHGEEGFFDTIGPLISKGVKFATPLLKQGAKMGLQKVIEALDQKTESDLDTNPSEDAVSGPLFERATVGECALQAIMKLPPSKLKALTLYDHDGNETTEGFFDAFKGTIQTIGRKVLSTAPDVMKAVGPIALDLLKGAVANQAGQGSESTFVPDDNTVGTTPGKVIPIGALFDGPPLMQISQPLMVGA